MHENFQVTLSTKQNRDYPISDEFTYVAKLRRVNLEEARKRSLSQGRGFVLQEPQTIKKDLKSEYSIYSSKYGQTLQDANPFIDRYKCECGGLRSRVHHGMVCSVCNTRVKYVDDDFGYFGWICLKDPYKIIHPNLFKSIEFLIGYDNLKEILEIVDEKDENGFSKPKKRLDGTFKGIGMQEFIDRFFEIIEHFANKNPNKRAYYDDIMQDKDKIFIQSIPVYTTLLRPFKVDGDTFSFEGTNATYNIMCRLACAINKDDLKMFRKKKPKNLLLYDLQVEYNKLYKEIEDIMSKKKGIIRSLLGGRYNFTSRSVIIPNPSLRINQVTLPYHALVELLQQRIINILKKEYNISYSEAYKIWYRAQVKKDEHVYDIINGIIKASNGGIPILINRNPTINFGGILCMRCIAISKTFTMNVPLQILKPLAADFDGDCLNILLIINEEFLKQADAKFNPRNALYISKNDGRFNNDVNHCRDTLINANTMIYLSRYNYTEKQLNAIKAAQQAA